MDPKLLEIAERFHFLNSKQQPGEMAVDIFVVAITCNFWDDVAEAGNVMLQDQFVSGLVKKGNNFFLQ